MSASNFKESRRYTKIVYNKTGRSHAVEISCKHKRLYDDFSNLNEFKLGCWWCIYLYVYKDATPNLFSKLEPYLNNHYDSEDIDSIDFHAGCTYANKENDNCIKIGCDFGHLNDEFYENTPMEDWKYFVPIAERYEANLINLINKYDHKEATNEC